MQGLTGRETLKLRASRDFFGACVVQHNVDQQTIEAREASFQPASNLEQKLFLKKSNSIQPQMWQIISIEDHNVAYQTHLIFCKNFFHYIRTHYREREERRRKWRKGYERWGTLSKRIQKWWKEAWLNRKTVFAKLFLLHRALNHFNIASTLPQCDHNCSTIVTQRWL